MIGDRTGRQRHYAPFALEQVVWVLPTGKGDTGGKYKGKILRPADTSTVTDATTMTLAELGEADPDDDGNHCVLCNFPEMGKSTWELWSGSVGTIAYLGTIRGVNNEGQLIVATGSEFCSTASPASLGGSGTTADVATWHRDNQTSGTDYGSTAFTVTQLSRLAWDGGTNTLYQFVRTYTYDACGKVVSVSAETRTVVDNAADCT